MMEPLCSLYTMLCSSLSWARFFLYLQSTTHRAEHGRHTASTTPDSIPELHAAGACHASGDQYTPHQRCSAHWPCPLSTSDVLGHLAPMRE